MKNSKGGIISNDEEVKDLHGDWLLVTKRKKTTNHPTLNALKSVTYTTNKFNVLAPQAHQVKPSATQYKLPPRPNPFDITCTNKSTSDSKRCRQEVRNYLLIIT